MAHPREGDRILLLRREWLDLVIDRVKTLEIHGAKLKGANYFLGCRGQIHGYVKLGDAIPIRTSEEWNALRLEHCVDGDAPYKTTFAIPIKCVKRMKRPFDYVHPRGAIGIVKYHSR